MHDVWLWVGPYTSTMYSSDFMIIMLCIMFPVLRYSSWLWGVCLVTMGFMQRSMWQGQKERHEISYALHSHKACEQRLCLPTSRAGEKLYTWQLWVRACHITAIETYPPFPHSKHNLVWTTNSLWRNNAFEIYSYIQFYLNFYFLVSITD